jgi:hypothetical protein
MKPTTLIVLRGPSGSGKSSVARVVRAVQTTPTALVEQDYLRRILLKEKDVPNGVNIELIKRITLLALAHSYNVIMEGIFDKGRYAEMFKEILQAHPVQNYLFYFHTTFAETLRRHEHKPNHDEFGETEMRGWYKELDLFDFVSEEIIPESSTLEETTKRIITSIH